MTTMPANTAVPNGQPALRSRSARTTAGVGTLSQIAQSPDVDINEHDGVVAAEEQAAVPAATAGKVE